MRQLLFLIVERSGKARTQIARSLRHWFPVITVAVVLVVVILMAGLIWGRSLVVEVATAVGEWGVVFIIYLEVESTRLDHFYEKAFERKHGEARRKIYEKYCEDSEPSSKKFCEGLKSGKAGDTDNLTDACKTQIALLEVIGGQLPWWPPFRKRVLDWFPHAIVFLWVILEVYVSKRRVDTGWSSWGKGFEDLARKAAQHIVNMTDGGITLVDPDPQRGNNYPISREELQKLAQH